MKTFYSTLKKYIRNELCQIDSRINELEQRLNNLFETVSGQPGISSDVDTLKTEVADIKVGRTSKRLSTLIKSVHFCSSTSNILIIIYL